jgi:hypothetical protein
VDNKNPVKICPNTKAPRTLPYLHMCLILIGQGKLNKFFNLPVIILTLIKYMLFGKNKIRLLIANQEF